MIRIAGIILDFCILTILTLDYFETRRYEVEVNDVKHRLWKLEHKLSELNDCQRMQWYS